MKQIIFNVGGALSTYTEFDDKKLMVDIGGSAEFNPVIDFLLPLFKKRGNDKSSKDANKYAIDQLIISHPHDDHISAIAEFQEHFYPELLTCPNDNIGMPENQKINWELFDKNPNIDILREMLIGRVPPLRTTSDQNEFIYFLAPKDVEGDTELSSESYCNNISICTFLIINTFRMFMPGDVQKLGMIELISKNNFLRNKLKGGVDVLIAPHHGLRSSFSTEMFDLIRNGKTRSLNIISEKVAGDDARNVDTRYSSSDYCEGDNNLKNGDTKTNQIKTSRGHIYIDYQKKDYINIEVFQDIKDVFKRFI